MNARTSICTAFALTSIAAVQPGWAQLIDPATQLREPVPHGRRLYDMPKTGMSAEVIRPSGSDAIRRAEGRNVSPTVIEQIGKVKQSMPNSVGVR